MISLHLPGIIPKMITAPASDCLSAIAHNGRLFELYTAGAAAHGHCKLGIIPLTSLQFAHE